MQNHAIAPAESRALAELVEGTTLDQLGDELERREHALAASSPTRAIDRARSIRKRRLIRPGSPANARLFCTSVHSSDCLDY